jgi:glycosyltransferase involved in cell wall biosynthesis
LRREAEDASAVVACHPYLYPVLKDLGAPVWYEEQDLEAHIKGELLKDLPHGEELTAAVRKVEGDCVRAAEVILCTSDGDARQLVASYGIDAARIVEAPNGTDVSRVLFTAGDERAALKDRLGLGTERLAFFMGSGHWPNIEAVQRIFEFASELPSVAFLVIGSVCYAFDPRMKPANVLFLGEVDDVTRNVCLQACDLALNPMQHGSGTNIKMLDYFAAGIPVVTTEQGARGLGIQDGAHCLVRPIEEFASAIGDIVGDGAAGAAARAVTARTMVEERFDWEAIGRRIKPRLLAALAQERAA